MYVVIIDYKNNQNKLILIADKYVKTIACRGIFKFLSFGFLYNIYNRAYIGIEYSIIKFKKTWMH